MEELKVPRGVCVRIEGDGEFAVVAVAEGRAGVFVVLVGCIGPEDGGSAATDDLEPIVEVLAGSERLGTEAGGRVVQLDERERRRSVVRNGGGDGCGMAADEGEGSSQRGKELEGAHPGLGYQA